MIDDETTVRLVAQKLLERLGFEVLTAADGPEGLATLDAEGETIDAVLVDLSMPGMSGEEVLEQVRQRRPRLPMVLMSGYSESSVATAIGDDPPTVFLGKPFSLEDLRTQLARALA